LWTGRTRLFADDREVPRLPGRPRRFHLLSGDDASAEILLKPRGYVDPAPRVFIDGTELSVVRDLKWYEYVVGLLPVLLVFFGGFIGGALGALGAITNFRVLRSHAKVGWKIVGILAVTFASAAVYFAVLTAFMLFG
jgi:hypothetical protein